MRPAGRTSQLSARMKKRQYYYITETGESNMNVSKKSGEVVIDLLSATLTQTRLDYKS